MELINSLRESRRLSIPLLVFALLASLVPVLATSAAAASSAKTPHHIGANIYLNSRPPRLVSASALTPPDNAYCASIGRECLTPSKFRKAYYIDSLLKSGYTGKGQTIVIIDSFGSPTALKDLKQFDKDYHLPDPPSFKQIAPIGSVPFDPKNADQIGWAEETSLDIQWAHVVAPQANIVVLTSPVAETQGVQGMPEFLQLEQYALKNHIGNIITQSWGTTENTLFTPEGKKILDDFNAFYKQAAKAHITVLASTGDAGVSNPDVDGKNYPFPTVGFPASSPYVTAVGGTSLYTKDDGTYLTETVWNHNRGASGSGVSQYFPEPDYQKLLPKKTQASLLDANPADKADTSLHRGIPDISLNADPQTGVPVYLGFETTGPIYGIFGGTSASSPEWAGLIADGNQMAKHPLGFINPAIYNLSTNAKNYSRTFHDVTIGNTSLNGTPGYAAHQGWDLASGFGTPNDTSYLLKEIAAYK